MKIRSRHLPHDKVVKVAILKRTIDHHPNHYSPSGDLNNPLLIAKKITFSSTL